MTFKLVSRAAGARGCARKRRAGLTLVASAIVFFGVARPATAEGPLLAEAPLAGKLRQPVTVAWQGQQLGTALAGLAEVHALPLWIDRRIDPSAAVNLSVSDRSLADALDALVANKAPQWGWTSLRTVIYFGPRESARELATLSELARQAIAHAPNDVRRKWLTTGPWKIARLSEPRALLGEIATDVGTDLRGAEEIPHDLWGERTLSAIAPIDRAVLLSAGFNLCVEPAPDGRHLRVVPIRRPIQLTRTYSLNERIEAIASELASTDDDMRIRKQGRRLAVAARWEEHEQLRAASRNESSAENGADSAADAAAARPRGEQRFTLRIASKPVGPVLKQLAAQLRLTVEWDPALLAATPKIVDTLVSCEVREADLDALLKAILEPAELTFDRAGQTLTIRAAN